jgi:hypothetical protein
VGLHVRPGFLEGRGGVMDVSVLGHRLPKVRLKILSKTNIP